MAPVVYLVRDLVFVSKIREAAARLGLEVERAADASGLHAAAREAKLVIVDLRLPEAIEALQRLAADPLTARVRAVGFVDHEQVEAMAARSVTLNQPALVLGADRPDDVEEAHAIYPPSACFTRRRW